MKGNRALPMLAIALLALSGSAFALSVQSGTYGGVDITRISPESIATGQKAWVMLVFENTGKTAAKFTITDLLGDADFNKSAATATNTTYGTRWTYAWDISLPAGENTSVAYWIAPKSPGEYVIAPSPVVINGATYYLDAAYIEVECNADGVCASGENAENCPQDCKSGGADGVCDAVKDGICDPDCAQGYDADCAAAGGTGAYANQTAGTSANATGAGTPFEGQACAPAAAIVLLFAGVAAFRFR